jgi:AcrR family transcriptional regulator
LAVVAAATEAFTRGGYTATTMSDVAGAAGVAEGTVFLHFGSKAGLLIAVMQRYYDELAATCVRVAEDNPDPVERLRALTLHWARRLRDDWSLTSNFAQQGRFHTDPELAEQFIACNRQITRIYGGVVADLQQRGVLDAELPVRVIRDTIFGTLEHLVISHATLGRPADIDAAAEALVRLVLHGAGTDVAAAPGQLARIEEKLDDLLART